MLTPPIESLFRAFRRDDRNTLAASPAGPVGKVTPATRVADDARAGGTQWRLEPAPDSSRAREDPAPAPGNATARGDPRAPAPRTDLVPAQPFVRDNVPALLTDGTRMTAAGFAQGTREALPGPAARNTAPVREGERDDATAALLASRARAPVGAATAKAPVAYAEARDAAPRFSATGQLVSELMPQSARTSPGGIVRAPEALLGMAAGDPQALARALQESIARSGLFYESHLADWTLQRGTLESLAREPQAQWWAQTSASAAFTMADGARDATAVPAPLENVSALRHLRMQLETLESGRVQWQGELWPRQPAHIAIEAEGWSCGSPDPAAAAVWRSRVRLELPHLGVVDAELVLTGGALRVRVQPESRLAEQKLAAARGEIDGALAARFAASSVTVSHAPDE